MNGDKKGPKQVKILIAASIYPPDPGGPATHAKRQFEGFAKEGFAVSLVVLRTYRSLPIGLRHIVYFFHLLQKGVSCDVIYAHDALGVGLPALFGGKTLEKKIVMRVGGDIPWEREAETGKTVLSMNEWYSAGDHEEKLSFKISKFVLQRIDDLIVPSQLLADLYVNHYQVHWSRISVVSNPISSREIDADIRKDQTIIFASRLVAYKNLSFVLSALPPIFLAHEHLTFVVMGDGPEKEHLQKQAQQLGIDKKVIFTGSISQQEVVENTKHCLLGLAPALTEFNPNYILECIAYGKPFLMSRENGLPFAVPEACLFDTRNAKEFQQKLEELLTEEGYQKATHALSTLKFSMSWDDVIQENIKIIRNILRP